MRIVSIGKSVFIVRYECSKVEFSPVRSEYKKVPFCVCFRGWCNVSLRGVSCFATWGVLVQLTPFIASDSSIFPPLSCPFCPIPPLLWRSIRSVSRFQTLSAARSCLPLCVYFCRSVAIVGRQYAILKHVALIFIFSRKPQQTKPSFRFGNFKKKQVVSKAPSVAKWAPLLPFVGIVKIVGQNRPCNGVGFNSLQRGCHQEVRKMSPRSP